MKINKIKTVLAIVVCSTMVITAGVTNKVDHSSNISLSDLGKIISANAEVGDLAQNYEMYWNEITNCAVCYPFSPLCCEISQQGCL